MKINTVLFLVFSALVILISCKKLLPKAIHESEILDGPVEGLTTEETARFLKGDAAFTEVFTSAKGLGSTFVASSCVSCHAGDGKGHPSTTLTRFGQPDEFGNQYLDFGGPQLQNKALPGYMPEQIPAGATFSKFTPPANTGLGFLDFVTDATILAMADPNDADGDGISGVPNWITIPDYVTPRSNAITQNGKYICRFGKKAAAYDLLHQTVNAYNQDMGIASSYNPIDVYTHQAIDPEISNQSILDLVFYLRTLKAPIPRDQDDPEVQQGKAIFNQLNCTGCHKPTLTTGYSPIAALSNKEFHPFTDLLLHDMGAGLNDGYTEGSAKTAEWRTPPLWGLGLSAFSQGGSFFLMHDGRAHSIEEAILLHGGEAATSRGMYQNLNESDRSSLITYLLSL
ncbi:MAG: c-type cytochrome [Flavobacteriia bacterium]|nr:c-type cytochrome [Flavobacteriia bacterium]